MLQDPLSLLFPFDLVQIFSYSYLVEEGLGHTLLTFSRI